VSTVSPGTIRDTDFLGMHTAGEEQVAWQKLSGELDEQLLRIVGDVMVASACISYYGPLSDDYRVLLVNGWVESCQNLGLQVSENFSVRATLASDVEVRDWNIHGLPSNRLSVDNGVIVTKCQRWPLLIDPQLQGSRWIKGMYGETGKLRVTRLSESNWLRQLENAVQHGFGFMIEDVAETLDPSLAPVLLKQIYSSGGRKVIKLGDQEIDYDPEFRLYITSKMPNPHYLPEVCIQTTLVNFTVTYDGLEDQLLGEVVRKERPDLETQKDRIVVSMAADRKQLQDLQDRALQLLFESEGMILDNEPLVNTLQQSKQTSIIIERRFKEAEQTDLSISQAREMYRIVAKRGSLIYFVIADLAALNPMYQYSLEYFKRIYGYCIEVSAKSDDLDERLQILLSFVTSFMYKSVCRGLFEEHKALFSFLVCVAIQQDAGSIQLVRKHHASMSKKARPRPMLHHILCFHLLLSPDFLKQCPCAGRMELPVARRRPVLAVKAHGKSCRWPKR
jgi:dynein heavy chain